MRKPSYEIVGDDVPGMPLVIRDLGPWDRHPSVTNAVEEVVKGLVESGRLTSCSRCGCSWRPGSATCSEACDGRPVERKLLYYDSEGVLDEIVVEKGVFSGFAILPQDAVAGTEGYCVGDPNGNRHGCFVSNGGEEPAVGE